MAATSKNSAAPDSPNGSSPLASNGIATRLIGWFTTIVDFIRSMSPSNAATYDSGWVDITYGSGYKVMFAKAQVRRVGFQTIIRGDITRSDGGDLPLLEEVVGNVPSGFRPPRSASDARKPLTGLGINAAIANINVSGEIRVVATGSVGWVSLSPLSGYTVD